MEAELPEEKIEEALNLYAMLGSTAKIGFEAALARCHCHMCIEILQRINCGDLR